jgi:hypothetical protein
MLYVMFFVLLITSLKLSSMSHDGLAEAIPIARVAHLNLSVLSLEQHIANVRQNFSNLSTVPKRMRSQVLRHLGISHLLAVVCDPRYHDTRLEYIVLDYLVKNEILLNLSSERDITPKRIQELSSKHPNVTILILPATIEKVDTFIKAVATGFKKLRYLALQESKITANDAYVLAEGLLQLEELDLSRNQAIIDQDFVKALFRLPYLNSLNVQSSIGLTPEARALLDGWNRLPGKKAIY